MQDTAASAGAPELPRPSVFFRWAVLFFISLAMFGNYYVYDSIAPLADVLKTQLGFNDTHIGTLNAIYSVPNILMVLIGGIIIDRIGTRRSTVLFAMICMIGALVTVASGQFLRDGRGAADLRAGFRVADRGGDHRAGPLVSREGTELRLRAQPDTGPLRLVCGGLVADLVPRRLRALARPTADLAGLCLRQRDQRRRCTGSSSRGPRDATGSARPARPRSRPSARCSVSAARTSTSWRCA